ncbi:MAG: light-harvesting protein [Alphaproteobacteria bacterium PA4]|nr:MAG: light-harvesting protein [Alphaproteobacteria bacterium PA4]
MWRVWQTFNPQRILTALAVFLFTLAVLIHFILLSTDRYNWLDGAEPKAAPTAAVESVNGAA